MFPLSFYKVQATGNDFIVLDGRDLKDAHLSAKQIQFLCDRHFGIGSDGLIILSPGQGGSYRFVYYNADGSRGAMCGNGGRAGVLMAQRFGYIPKSGDIRFLADDGWHLAQKLSGNEFRITLNITAVPVPIDSASLGLEIDVRHIYWVNTGVPHLILILAQAPADKHLLELGPRLRYHPRFAPQGCNINFLWQNNSRWSLRTYERGVEAETLSCGTGIAACGLALGQLGSKLPEGIGFSALGGKLGFKKEKELYWLNGAVAIVCKGEVEIPN